MTRHEITQEQHRIEAENRRTYPLVWCFAFAVVIGGAVLLVALRASDDWLLDRVALTLALTALSVIATAPALVLLWGCHRRAKRLAALSQTKE
jgi:hypothetical protein